MPNPRLVLAVGLAAATLALLLAVIAAGGALRAGLAPIPGRGAVMMAAALVLSEKLGAFLVAGLLAAIEARGASGYAPPSAPKSSQTSGSVEIPNSSSPSKIPSPSLSAASGSVP